MVFFFSIATKKLSVTEADTEKVCKDWLQYAKDHCGGRNKRVGQAGTGVTIHFFLQLSWHKKF